MKHLYQSIIGLALAALFFPGCAPVGNKNKCGPCPEFAEELPHLNFQLVSKTTGANLFYGSAAAYKVNQLAMHHIVNGKPDTVYFHADTASQGFFVFVAPLHNVDTVTMKIANLPQDTLLFHTGTTGGCCPLLVLNSISYDGTLVYAQSDGNKLVVLPK